MEIPGADNKGCLESTASVGRLNEFELLEAPGGRGVGEGVSLSTMSSCIKNS